MNNRWMNTAIMIGLSLLPTNSLAASSMLLSIPPIIARAGIPSGAPEAFIDSADVKDGKISLIGYFKDKEGDPLISASWVLKDYKGKVLYEFSGLEVTDAAMEAKGDITIVFTVTTGTGSDLKTSAPANKKISV